MNDRERIARAIDPLAWVEYGDRRHRDLTLQQADAVLAALGDRLLPELPEWVDAIHAYQRMRMGPSGEWLCIASGYPDGLMGPATRWNGGGPNPSAAIRDALNGGDR